MTLLEVRNVTKRFGGLAAVDDLSFTLDASETLGLIGPNGAGKTTTFNVLSGFTPPTSGTVIFDGSVVSGLKPHQICAMGLARTFQVVQPFPELTTVENVMVGAFVRAADPSEARSTATDILQRIGLSHKQGAMAQDLTLLELKRLEIGRALATRPRLLLLDEVAAGLKPAEIDEVLDLLREINRGGVAVILVEHVMRVVHGLAQRIIVMDFGRRIAEGSFEEISADPVVLDAYLGSEGEAFE